MWKFPGYTGIIAGGLTSVALNKAVLKGDIDSAHPIAAVGISALSGLVFNAALIIIGYIKCGGTITLIDVIASVATSGAIAGGLAGITEATGGLLSYALSREAA